ncbi:DUF2333 family protein [Desulfosarcina sp.]|uniref:DUF2333 family protein n=1 Tax=Desulfosarcina sp. TaxID=2027861 RepID=UPI003566E0B1
MEKNAKGFEFKKFATPRIIGGIAIAIIILWALSIIFGTPQAPTSEETSIRQLDSATATSPAGSNGRSKTTLVKHPSEAARAAKDHSADAAGKDTTAVHGTTAAVGTATQEASGSTRQRASADSTDQAATGSHGKEAARKTTATRAGAPHEASEATRLGATTHSKSTDQKTDGSHQAPAAGQTAAQGTVAKTTGSATARQTDRQRLPVDGAGHSEQASGHGATSQTTAKQGASGHAMPAAAGAAPVHKPAPKGVAFVAATIKPLSVELEERWWGWRPNDIIEFTDNVNRYQLGVLEVTRRTVVALAERISRTGVTDALDPNLEDAMNWFMVKASSYWFPSAESKYQEGLEELQAYLEKLKAGNATFYTRSDNLIPLLASFEDLLGSCDENLVKETNEDGTTISFFDADNYFYYTQGVASSMATVLEAVHHDFLITLESRNAAELLHHAIVSCQRAAELDPWIVLDRNLSSIFANHRANMAAPISHARFYIGQLIKTLST